MNEPNFGAVTVCTRPGSILVLIDHDNSPVFPLVSAAFRLAPPARFELALPPPEGGALSPELRGLASVGRPGRLRAERQCTSVRMAHRSPWQWRCLRRSILDPCRAVSAVLTPRGRPCSSCCSSSPAAYLRLRPHQPQSGPRRRPGVHRGTPFPTSTPLALNRNRSAVTKTHTSSLFGSPWIACQWKFPPTSELTGYARYRLQCTRMTPPGRYGWRAGKRKWSRSGNSLRSGVCGSMVAALGRRAKP